MAGIGSRAGDRRPMIFGKPASTLARLAPPRAPRASLMTKVSHLFRALRRSPADAAYAMLDARCRGRAPLRRRRPSEACRLHRQVALGSRHFGVSQEIAWRWRSFPSLSTPLKDAIGGREAPPPPSANWRRDAIRSSPHHGSHRVGLIIIKFLIMYDEMSTAPGHACARYARLTTPTASPRRLPAARLSSC